MIDLLNQRSFQEERLLMRELSHRVNNELTSAISIVSLAASRSPSPDVKIALNDVSQRLHHYADVHRALQVPEHTTRIDVAVYFRHLCLAISRSKLDFNDIKLVLTTRSLSMRSDRCWRLGLIVYELITNSARHAFRGIGGEIWVELRPLGSSLECRVADNGLTPPTVQQGRGLRIVRELVTSLDGQFEQSFGHRGSSAVITLPM